MPHPEIRPGILVQITGGGGRTGRVVAERQNQCRVALTDGRLVWVPLERLIPVEAGAEWLDPTDLEPEPAEPASRGPVTGWKRLRTVHLVAIACGLIVALGFASVAVQQSRGFERPVAAAPPPPPPKAPSPDDARASQAVEARLSKVLGNVCTAEGDFAAPLAQTIEALAGTAGASSETITQLYSTIARVEEENLALAQKLDTLARTLDRSATPPGIARLRSGGSHEEEVARVEAYGAALNALVQRTQALQRVYETALREQSIDAPSVSRFLGWAKPFSEARVQSYQTLAKEAVLWLQMLRVVASAGAGCSYDSETNAIAFSQPASAREMEALEAQLSALRASGPACVSKARRAPKPVVEAERADDAPPDRPGNLRFETEVNMDISGATQRSGGGTVSRGVAKPQESWTQGVQRADESYRKMFNPIPKEPFPGDVPVPRVDPLRR